VTATVDAVCAGGVILDCSVSASGAVALEVMGGNAAWSAVGARIGGASPGIVATVPAAYPQALLDGLVAGGIALDGIARVDGPMPLPEWFFYAADGTRIDRLHASAEAFGAMGFSLPLTGAAKAAWLQRLRERTEDGRGFTVFRRTNPPPAIPAPWRGAPGLHLAPDLPGAQIRLAAQARSGGARVITLDPGPHALADGPDAIGPLLTACDAFLPSERELAVMLPGLTAADALSVLAVRTPALLAVKLGPRGALLWDRSALRAVRIPALPVPASDPTGAGDAFCGGVLAGLLRGETQRDALRRGTVSASFAVGTSGADRALAAAVPSEVAARLAAVHSMVEGST
jgi:ribokinase